MFLISPYSANLSWISSSVASSWTPVTNRIQPSTAVGEGRLFEHTEKNFKQDYRNTVQTQDWLSFLTPFLLDFSLLVPNSLQTQIPTDSNLLTALWSGFITILLHAVIIFTHPRSRPLFYRKHTRDHRKIPFSHCSP